MEIFEFNKKFFYKHFYSFFFRHKYFGNNNKSFFKLGKLKKIFLYKFKI
jgi:hypothetical protein